ncbi:MAG: thiosulfate oxidation carrier complex protein SoxZ [gamma proteobacterium symbiont of Phacoides pectinatus]
MAKKSMKIRAKEQGGVVTVKALITHPMETGQRKDSKTGETIPAHYIQEVTCKTGDTTVMNALFSGGVSKNPYVSFKYSGKKGDALTMSWSDNQGDSDSTEVKVG